MSDEASPAADGRETATGELVEPGTSDTEFRFRHETIDANPPSGRLFICHPTDITGDGRPDLIVGGMGSTDVSTFVPGLTVERSSIPGYFFKRFETDLFWYENSTWERHDMTDDDELRLLGSTLVDFDGDGSEDVVVGQGLGFGDIYWFERPADPRKTWTKRLLRSDFEKYHDLAFGDVDNDGKPELVGVSQESETLFYYDVPDDPRRTPWPAETKHVIESGVDLEGLCIVDLDGDGRNELIAGTHVYRQTEAGDWKRETVVSGWDWTRVAVADLDGDGELEVVFTEGDSPLLGNHPGRVAWFDPPNWEQHTLRDDMYCPHSLQIEDFTGNGLPDIYVSEMGLDTNDDPQHLIFENMGDGTFEEHVIATGVETHEAKAVDMTGDGRLDIVGKSYEPNTHVDIWYNES
ncbi:VCBS repeat-containing protein [Halogeometricum luteum]|uniref:VCBS repeat-containing protein n=1 Tax=Halogeometricum luteum TaxID=2950537 RepID=A0ABU2G220_9EURY|nr:VCBS repeat-containing protein [Halogeometricum sp. S3BR5-2]MDS0294294.1 VCBS repeat-containing protein [Halogeometricum sp. S3BR5-2]